MLTVRKFTKELWELEPSVRDKKATKLEIVGRVESAAARVEREREYQRQLEEYETAKEMAKSTLLTSQSAPASLAQLQAVGGMMSKATAAPTEEVSGSSVGELAALHTCGGGREGQWRAPAGSNWGMGFAGAAGASRGASWMV